jgi:hypothetical protein
VDIVGRQPRRRRLVCSLFRLLWILCNVDPILSHAPLLRMSWGTSYRLRLNRAAMLAPILDPGIPVGNSSLCWADLVRISDTVAFFLLTKKSRIFNRTNFTT